MRKKVRGWSWWHTHAQRPYFRAGHTTFSNDVIESWFLKQISWATTSGGAPGIWYPACRQCNMNLSECSTGASVVTGDSTHFTMADILGRNRSYSMGAGSGALGAGAGGALV